MEYCNKVVKVNLEPGMDSFHRYQHVDPKQLLIKTMAKIDMIIALYPKIGLREVSYNLNLLPGIKRYIPQGVLKPK
jgi:hypothetical protein